MKLKKLELFQTRMEKLLAQDAASDWQTEIFMYIEVEKNVKFVNLV